jgi:DNA replication protein DnaC
LSRPPARDRRCPSWRRRVELKARNGDPGDRIPCPLGVCDGSGWILGPEDVARPCECRDRIVARARLSGVASVIPAKYRGVSFDRPPVTQIDKGAVTAVSDFCAGIDSKLDTGAGLWFCGNSGTGKTTLAMLLSRTALEAGRSVAIYSVPSLLARIRRTYEAETGEQSYMDFFERITTVDLLHLDDLGAERRTDWVMEQLYALINERYEGNRSMVVTSNSDEQALREEIGERIVSRLDEMCELIPLYGADQRVSLSAVDAAHSSQSSKGAPSVGSAGLGPLDH